MFATPNENCAQVEQFGAIEFKCSNSGAARRREAQNKRLIVVPSKMFVPVLAARMKERHACAGVRVGCVKFVGLMAVAANTGIRQIIQFS